MLQKKKKMLSWAKQPNLNFWSVSIQFRMKLNYNNTKIICFAFSAAEGKRAVLNVVLHRHLLGTDGLEKRMWMDRNIEWQVEEIRTLSLKPLLI